MQKSATNKSNSVSKKGGIVQKPQHGSFLKNSTTGFRDYLANYRKGNPQCY